MKEFDNLKLESQLCFPLYACSKEVIRKYTPLLKKIDLTYTQYITMLVLWENNEINIKTLGEQLFLDSGTLTPLLKKLESKGLITRKRNNSDERNLVVSLTKKGENLKKDAKSIPESIEKCLNIEPDDALKLYEILYKILRRLNDE